MKKDTDSLEFRAKIANIGAMPLLVTVVGCVPAVTGAALARQMNLKQLILILVRPRRPRRRGLYVGSIVTLIRGRRPRVRSARKFCRTSMSTSISAIQIQSDTNVDLVHGDSGWTVAERNNYPANFSQISDLLIKLSQLKTVQSDAIGPSQLARMHLEEPGHGSNSAVVLELKSAKGVAATLLLGKKHYQKEPGGPSEMGDEGFPDGRYLMVKANPNTVITVSDALSSVEPSPAQWLNKDFFKVDEPASISLVSTNATNSWTIARASTTGPWVLAGAGTNDTVDSSKAGSIAGALGYPSFVDLAPANSVTGLDRPQTVTLTTFDHFTYTLKIGNKTPENNYYINVAVAADLPSTRTPDADEKPDVKKKLDQEFQDKLKQWQDKFKKKQTLASWTFLVNNWMVDPFLRNRSDLLAERRKPGGNRQRIDQRAAFPEAGGRARHSDLSHPVASSLRA